MIRSNCVAADVAFRNPSTALKMRLALVPKSEGNATANPCETEPLVMGNGSNDDEAEAHPRTKIVQRCPYDPVAGQSCWNETVSVAQVHRRGRARSISADRWTESRQIEFGAAASPPSRLRSDSSFR